MQRNPSVCIGSFRRLIALAWLIAAVQFAGDTAFGQGYTGDARRIGMGGGNDGGSVAFEMMQEDKPYRSFVVPFGLIQLVKDRHRFDPGDDSFDPVRLLEDIANPLHYTFGRETASSTLVNDLVHARISRDLTAYRGFVPASKIRAEGLAAPSFGHTFHV